ncbi:hypothetical protein FA95DRAFT_1614437 [Auriscalpium vulgare]|uniref:Uncharacterized protein n=1 Tax=Auriscalpium vulgare TaxID=40419 RepID=A0ACB8QZM6_9AGAM|nr:hypothetical protein FA95DRAFT_1614437 [Auriscalpium vulgare]
MGDTRNISLEDVARHFANNGYHPRSLSITEFEDYATSRRNLIEGRHSGATDEWNSYPTLAEMNILYPPAHASNQTSGPPRNLYPNLSLDLRSSSGDPRPATPEGPALSRSSGTMSPDFPDHYVPPTPHSVPLDNEAAGSLPTEAISWADDLFVVNNNSVPTVNNIAPVSSAVDPTTKPLPPSRPATPMDSTD